MKNTLDASVHTANNAVKSHIFSVDLEDWYHVSAFEGHVPRNNWQDMESRVAYSTRILLDLLDSKSHSATFFVLGWVAEKQPDLIREVAERGHEIASHTWWHRRVYTQSPSDFELEVKETRERLEQITGQSVSGFRAPSFSITPQSEWAFEALINAGYSWDSSVFPIRRPGYGWPGAPRSPYYVKTASGNLMEYPLATLQIGSAVLPGAGGAYLRHLPLTLVKRAIEQAENENRPAMLYVHPWEVDTGQPRLNVGAVTKLRHYGGLERMAPRLERLFSRYSFTSVQKWKTRSDRERT